jgi:carbonic anhydrase
MSCGINEGSLPINVVKTNNRCSKTCNFEFNYGISDLTVINKGTYLKLSYNSKMTNVSYNGTQYNVKDIRLYSPSINQYNNQKYNAEIFIHHISNTGQNLLVCVPIKMSSNNSASHSFFNSIIKFSPTTINSKKNINVNNYTLNNLVPKGSFYSYVGSLPYDSCNGKYNIILFDPKYGLNIDIDDLRILKRIIKENNGSIKEIDSSRIQYNLEGTQKKVEGDDIYIDCNPVDDDDEEIITQLSNINTDTSGLGIKFNKENMKYVYTFSSIIGGFIIMYGLYKVGKKILNKTSGD